jgi:hypothetical protein
MLRPLKVIIRKDQLYPLTIEEIKYSFQTLLVIAGFPWHFVTDQGNESSDIYFGPYESSSTDTRATLTVRMCSIKHNSISEPVNIITEDGFIFLDFQYAALNSPVIRRMPDGSTIVNNDLILSVFSLLSGKGEGTLKRDTKDRHHIQGSFLWQNGLLHKPIVNQYADLLRSIFSPHNSFIPSWPNGKQYAVALSHDVDYPEIKPLIEVFRYIINNASRCSLCTIKKILNKTDHFFKFHEWLLLEEAYGVKSAFYFCGYVGTLLRYALLAPDPFYDIRKRCFKEVVQAIYDRGFEVGMHSSFLAYLSESRFRFEKEQIESVLGHTIEGNRHHYWHMNPDNPTETARMHESVGFLYDTSLAFECHSGFRRGICSPYHLFDEQRERILKIIQLPPALMDDHLFGYAKNSKFSNYQEHIRSLLASVKKHGGVFTVDYHQRVLNATFFPNWGNSYEFILKTIMDDSVYFDTPLNIVKHWIYREDRIKALSVQ